MYSSRRIPRRLYSELWDQYAPEHLIHTAPRACCHIDLVTVVYCAPLRLNCPEAMRGPVASLGHDLQLLGMRHLLNLPPAVRGCASKSAPKPFLDVSHFPPSSYSTLKGWSAHSSTIQATHMPESARHGTWSTNHHPASSSDPLLQSRRTANSSPISC